MARKKYYLGDVGPMLFDDESPVDDQDGDFAGEDRVAFRTDGSMRASGADDHEDALITNAESTAKFKSPPFIGETEPNKGKFTVLLLEPGSLLDTPLNGALEYNGKAIYFTVSGVRRAVTVGNDSRASDLEVSDTAAETTIHTSPISADELQSGKVHKVTIVGKFSTSSSSDFFTLRWKLGGSTILTAVMAAKNVSDAMLQLTLFLSIRTIGASGTYAASLEAHMGTERAEVTPVTGSIDTTTSEDITGTLQWDVADPDNIATIMQSVHEVIN